MYQYVRRTLCLLCLVSLVVCASAVAAEVKVQNMTLQNLDQVLADNNGKVVLINFFATWCPPCKEEIPGLVALRKNLGEDKVAILGVCVDETQAPVAPFVNRLKINYPVYWAKAEVPQRYGVRTIPHNVIYDTKGKIAANVTGFVSEADLKEFISSLLEQAK